MAVGKTSANLIRALYNLSKEHDAHKRKTLLNAGLVGFDQMVFVSGS